MPDDPIERLTADIEIYGIPQAPGMPPMTDALLHVRRRQDGANATARLGLPAYEGKQGPRGAPAAVHKGDKTATELGALSLSAAEVNWAYRNTDTNEQWVWTGLEWVVYADAYGTTGPAGPAPTVEAGTLTVGGDTITAPDFGVRVAGSAGTYTLGLDLPAAEKGDKGDTGDSGSIIDSVDIDDESTPSDGDTLVYVEADENLVWQATDRSVQEYVAPPSAFAAGTADEFATKLDVLVLSLPAKPWAYRLDISGDMDVDCDAATQILLEVRNGSTSGELVGLGRTAAVSGWRPVSIRSHSTVTVTPESAPDTIAADTAVNLYLSAVKASGAGTGWSVRTDRAQLRVKLLRV